MDRGLFIGRFQPFHNGHLEAVRRLAQQHDELILGIGSANVSHTATNPFTAGERLEMIRGALKDAQITAEFRPVRPIEGAGSSSSRTLDTHVLPVPIPDVGRNAVWVAHVKSLVPRFTVAHTNNPLPARLFREAGYQVAPVPFIERAKYEATLIRAEIAKGGSEHWKTLVPPAVAKVIVDVDGPRRIAELLRPDGRVEGADTSL